MAITRLIDRIRQAQDETSAPNDWLLLLEPFIDALNIPAEGAAATTAYVCQEARSAQHKYLSTKLGNALRLGTDRNDVEHNMRTLRHGRKPTLLVGEPGVGKTTWLMNFFQRSEVRRHSYHFRFDGRTARGGFSDSPPDRYIKAKLREGIIGAQQEAARRAGVRVAAEHISPYDPNHEAVERAILESAGTLRKAGLQGYLILDNFDRRPRDEQSAAVDYAHHAYAHLTLGAVVALRPYSVRDHELHDFECVTIPAPMFTDLIKARVDLAMGSRCGTALATMIREKFKLDLTWAGKLTNEHDLEQLWTKVADSLRSMNVLHLFLHRIHLADLHAIFQDVCELMATGQFADLMMRRLLDPQAGNEYDFLAAYLRGDFRHHRAIRKSGAAILNVYQADRSERDQFLYIRFLQFLRRATVGGAAVRFSDLKSGLAGFGYSVSAIERVAILMVRRRLVIEIHRMADWDEPNFTLEPSDQLAVSDCGDYYLDNLVEEPRYIQAMSHTTWMDDSAVNGEMQTSVSVESEYLNAYVLMREVGKVLLAELVRLDSDGKLMDFFNAIDSGKGFWCVGVAACQDVVRKLHCQGKLGADVLTKWQSLDHLVAEIRRLKARSRVAR